MNIKEIYNILETINYGWIDKEGNKHTKDYDEFHNNYKLQSPKSLLETKLGVCWDQVELERYLLKDLNPTTYYLILKDNNLTQTHTFLTYKLNNKFYWLEHAWDSKKGIREYNSLNELLKDVIISFNKEYNYDISKLELKEYSIPPYNIDATRFMNLMNNSKSIKIDFI